jgi:superfamily II RNA helicase
VFCNGCVRCQGQPASPVDVSAAAAAAAAAAGLVEAWAGGATWAEVMQDTSLDDGDMARLLARTADMLKQVIRLLDS